MSAEHPHQPIEELSNHDLGELGRRICRQTTWPTDPAEAAWQADVLEEWARRWTEQGPNDLFGQVEQRIIRDFAGDLRRLADHQREGHHER
jgi:hypothetical protein